MKNTGWLEFFKRDIGYRDDVPVESNYLAGVNEQIYIYIYLYTGDHTIPSLYRDDNPPFLPSIV